MLVRAHLRFLRIAPRKVRLVIDVVRGLPVDRALEQLSVLPKRSARPITKLIESAIANAEHNFKLERKDLFIKSIVANEGPRLKRYRPRAFGRAAEILKRMSHVTVVLSDGKAVKPAAEPVKSAAKSTAKPANLGAEAAKGAPAKPKPTTRRATAKPATAEDKPRRRSAEGARVARKGTS